ncbi:hypothetical protein PVAG01_08166 [Phlyctema vagabunda]|uniref:Uncharacterized protein n=1 Tax=Phlyctema vagabunda TaxID=108571 RepID=A0ABR4P8N0_9HELO
MGARSKFSFPLPGRKHSKEAKGKRGPEPANPHQNAASPGGLSKAQRILGSDGDLNIDSRTWDENSSRGGDQRTWMFPRPQSGTMSISISESTQSTHSGSGHHSEQWDQESGVLPRPRIQNKASSSLMSQHYNDEMGTDSSSLARRLRHEDSSSTIRSFYDRQKSPLAISQQTSASSARDLALRKGYPPVAQPTRSPLLNVESVDPFHEQLADAVTDSMLEKSRKKPAKLDLSALFAKAKKGVQDVASPSSSVMTGDLPHGPPSGRRRLAKAQSKESLQSAKHSIHSNQLGRSKTEDSRIPKREPVSHTPSPRDTHGTLYQLYDHYEQLPMKSSHMAQIPETRIADESDAQPRRRQQHPEPIPTPPKSRESRPNQEPQPVASKDGFSWKNVRASMVAPPWEGSSAASISSHNSKMSRQTSHSGISHSDLRQNSVLSLSSDSEDDQEDPSHSSSITLPIRNPSNKSESLRTADKRHLHTQQQPTSRTPDFHDPSNSLKPPPRSSKSRGGRKENRTSAFLAIPEAMPVVTRSRTQETDSRSVNSQDRSSSKRASSVTSASSLQPTPPLSPSSIEFRQSATRSSRFMAVTKQEEALLEALRQKRANMREKIIQEHERVSTSPESKQDRNRQRYSEASSINTVRGDSNKEEILLYLDTPVSDPRAIEAAEPSPDLSDFLSFESDADNDTTPRNSRIQTKNLAVQGRPRADSSTSPNRRDPVLPAAPTSSSITPRLSAVGSTTGFRDHRRRNSKSKRRPNQQNAVRFVDDSDFAVQQQRVRDTRHEPEVIWGISGHV